MLNQILIQYQNVPYWQIGLETIAFIFGILSVWFAKKENYLVFPTGIIATSITVYIMYKAQYMADMSINIYYTFMSIYGWHKWGQFKLNKKNIVQITQTNKKEKIMGFIMFLLTAIVCIGIYTIFKIKIQQNNWIDIFTTCIFFTAMWFMALKKIESWSLWIIGDFLIIPILWSRELYIFALQYIIFTILAILAYLEWKKILSKEKQILSE
ncbi:nicotinamide riboside transporter PnuC [Flavobacterium columnare]|uniref:Nicotinamide riboside transporter PnuC n=1 Tax=Flavobacterium columnare TaxID=996 RepID=A0A437UAI7_9FLAO|nr:nicotinamide riboside transporter PnuC [Flavobacterium columnare]RVU90646.1 nicotinamide riboside transporter PnuC [Flavobacterium columnare]